MMTPAAEIRDRWLARRDELRRLNASVDGAALCDEVLADLEKIVSDRAEKPVTVGLFKYVRLKMFTKSARMFRFSLSLKRNRRPMPKVSTGWRW